MNGVFNGQLLPETGISIQVSLAGDYTFTVINLHRL